MNYNTSKEFTNGTELNLNDIAGDATAIRQRVKAAINALVEVDDMVDFGEIAPGELAVGDLVYKDGFIGRIAHAKKRESDLSKDGFCYGFHLDYVSGDLSLFKYHLASICNGCFTGTRAYAQGNANARWHGMKC